MEEPEESRMHEVRKAKGLRQVDVAILAKVSVSSVGFAEDPSAHVLVKAKKKARIARALGVTPADLWPEKGAGHAGS